MCSCGARKVSKSETKEETKTESTDNSIIENKSETNIKTETTVKTDDKNETVTEETTYTPTDPTKEAFIIEKDGTKTVLNNAKKTVKKTTQKNNTQTNKTENSEIKQNSVFKEQKAVKHTNTSVKKENSKQVYKKQFNHFGIAFIGTLIIFIGYVIYRFYKKLPLVPKF
jgi:sensor c-di-GMP phosphodiesterase-like protein